MKKFAKTEKYTEVYEMMIYAHSPDVRDAKLSDVEDFLKVLLQCFPQSKSSAGTVKPYPEDSEYMKQWRAAVTHVECIIEAKKTKSRHKQIFVVSLLTLITLVLTLVYQVMSIETPKQKPSSELSSVTKEVTTK